MKVNNIVLPRPGLNVPLKRRERHSERDFNFAHIYIKKIAFRRGFTASGVTLNQSSSTFIQQSHSRIIMNLYRGNRELQVLILQLEAFLFNFDLGLKDFSMPKQQM